MQRFWDKVQKSQGCWLWQAGTRGKTGYGAFKYEGKTVDSHRVSYILAHGTIPDGMLVCHSCDVKLCVNPAHLFAGTYKDNWQDAVDKRIIKMIGTELSRKLTDGQVREVRKLYKRGVRGSGCESLAKIFPISHTSIRAIVSGKSYRDVT